MPLPQKLKDWIVPRVGQPKSTVAAPGLYHYQRELEDGYIRYHLRVDPDGHGLLIAGASEAMRLSPIGTFVAKALLDGQTGDSVAANLAANQSAVIEQVASALDELGRPSGRFPIFNITDPVSSAHRLQLMAPFQADVVPGDRATLDVVLPRLWQAGIPHVRWIPRNGLDAELLVWAVTRAEDIGMIAGVRALATDLAKNGLVIELAEAGLDYVVVPWGVTATLHQQLYGSGAFDLVGETIREIRRYEMCPVIEVPLIEQTIDDLDTSLATLTMWGVDHAEVFAIAKSDDGPSAADDRLTPLDGQALRQVAARTEELSAERPWQLIWLPPVEATVERTVEQLARRGPRAGGDISIRIEADGSVIPPRGPNHPAGNLLNQSWSEIWNHPTFERFREQVETGTRCDQCPGMSICASDCPADPQGWALA